MTLTFAEQQALLEASSGATADVLRDEQVAWRHPWRFEVARRLAEGLLRGPKALEGRRMLWEQREQYANLRYDLERHRTSTTLCWRA